MKADDPLLEMLACPIDKGALMLLASEEALYNPRLRRRYPILDGIPQLLPSSGEQVSDAEHERLVRGVRAREDEGARVTSGARTESGTDPRTGTGTKTETWPGTAHGSGSGAGSRSGAES